MAASDHPHTMHEAVEAVTHPMSVDTFVSLCPAQLLPLYRYFYHQTGHPQDAEDLVAITLGKALTACGHFDPARGTFPAWLFGIARHTLRDFQRRKRPIVSVTHLDPPLAACLPLPDAQVIQSEEAGILHARVRQLPLGQREAVMLYYFGSLSAREVAIVLGHSEGAVRLLIHRALTTLRERYREEEDT